MSHYKELDLLYQGDPRPQRAQHQDLAYEAQVEAAHAQIQERFAIWKQVASILKLRLQKYGKSDYRTAAAWRSLEAENARMYEAGGKMDQLQRLLLSDPELADYFTYLSGFPT